MKYTVNLSTFIARICGGGGSHIHKIYNLWGARENGVESFLKHYDEFRRERFENILSFLKMATPPSLHSK